jgi:nitrogen fixation NifU-like protein
MSHDSSSSSSTSSRNTLDAMYQEILLEHSRDPHHFGALPDADITADGYNPLCGDKVCIRMKLSGEKAEAVRFEGEACSICTASASILTDEAEGQSLPGILEKIERFRDLMQGKRSPEEFEGDLSSLAGVRNFPVRIKCALLPWTTLKEAIALRQESQEADSAKKDDKKREEP